MYTIMMNTQPETLSLLNLLCLLLSASSNPSIVDSVLTATAAPDLGNTIPPGTNFFPPARPREPAPSSLVFPPLFKEPPVALTLLVVDETEFDRGRNLRENGGLVKKSLKALVVGGGGGGAGGTESNDCRRMLSRVGECDFRLDDRVFCIELGCILGIGSVGSVG